MYVYLFTLFLFLISERGVFVCVPRLQCEVKLQRQQLSDSQNLLQSLRLELQVFEKIKTDTPKHNGTTYCDCVV